MAGSTLSSQIIPLLIRTVTRKSSIACHGTILLQPILVTGKICSEIHLRGVEAKLQKTSTEGEAIVVAVMELTGLGRMVRTHLLIRRTTTVF